MRKILVFIILVLGVYNSSFAKQVRVRELAPEISQPNFNGDTITLSSLKGKMVLVDFWASWCAPCRKEHPKLVEAFKKYQDKSFKGGEGFTIYSVSLDTNLKAWRNAVEKDNLPWTFHVSDLKGWQNEAAQVYNVTAIPSNYLIDGSGKIVAVNLRGKQLDQKLAKLQKGNPFWKWIWD